MQIQLNHGGGGGATADLIRRVFVPHLGNESLARMEDAAVLDAPAGRMALTTDTFVVVPLFFPGGDIGRLAVSGTVNDLLMMGAVPRWLTAGFILEAGLDSEVVERVATSMAATAAEAGIQVVAADTKVVEAGGHEPGLYINTSGVGWVSAPQPPGADRARPGDVLIVSGPLGDHQACIMSQRLGIQNSIRSDAAPLNRPVRALLDGGIAVHTLRDITRGGLATVLNELMDASKCQAELVEAQIPVAWETRALCDVLGLDPLAMANEGRFLAIVAAADAPRALALLRAEPLSREAAIIGAIQSGTGVVVQTRVGGRRRMTTPWSEGLPRIC